MLSSLVPSRTLQANPHIGPDGRWSIKVEGSPGDAVYILLSQAPDFRPFSFDGGMIHVGPSITGGRRFIGLIDGSGVLHRDLQLAAPIDGHAEQLWVQAAAVQSGEAFLTGPLVITRLTGAAPVLAATEVVHVDPSAWPGGSGRSWASAAQSIQAGAAAARGRSERTGHRDRVRTDRRSRPARAAVIGPPAPSSAFHVRS